jgi:hypothetical protein
MEMRSLELNGHFELTAIVGVIMREAKREKESNPDLW